MPKQKMYSEFVMRNRERRRMALILLLKSITKFFAFCIVVTFLIWGVLFSPLFRVSEIELIGYNLTPDTSATTPVTTDFINRSTLQNALDAIKADGAPNLILLNTDAVADELKQVHGVANAEVAKSWPGKLIIMLTPKHAVAIQGDDFVDSNAQPLAKVDSYPDLAATLPRLSLVPDTTIDAMRLLLAVKDEPQFAGGLAAVTSTSRHDISVTRSDGITVVFGDINNLTLKLADLMAILQIPELGGRKTIDLSSPNDPVAR